MPKKCKQNQMNPRKKLASLLISVAESSFFNALRQIQKKPGFFRHSRLRLCKAAERAFLSDTAFRGPQP
jgi:hypothetical protein